MPLVTHLFGVFDESSHRGGSIPISKANSKHVLERIALLKDSILDIEWAIINPPPICHPLPKLKSLIRDFEEEIDDLYFFYVGKVKQERSPLSS